MSHDTVKVIIHDINEFVEKKGGVAKFATIVVKKLGAQTQSVKARIVEIANNDVVLDLTVDNGAIDRLYKYLASRLIDQKTIVSDPDNPGRLTVRLAEIDSLRKTLDIVELDKLAFDETSALITSKQKNSDTRSVS